MNEESGSISLETVFHRSQIMATIMAMVRDYGEAEDIFQNTAVEIERTQDRFREGANFVPWARGIARNMVRRYYASRERFPVAVDMEDLEYIADVVEEAADAVPWEQESTALRHCLDRLSRRHQSLIQLKYAEGLDGRRVAARLGLSEKSIRTTVFRIREILRQCIDRRMAGEAALAGKTV